MIRIPPALVSAASASVSSPSTPSSGAGPERDGALDRRAPSTAAMPTPQPSVAANAIAAKPSSSALTPSGRPVAGQPVLDRPDDRQRADAEEQRCGDEALRDARVARAREALLDRVAEATQVALDADRLAGDAAQEHRAHHDDRVGVVPLEGVVDARAPASPCRGPSARAAGSRPAAGSRSAGRSASRAGPRRR